jgi:hypothetical protein
MRPEGEQRVSLAKAGYQRKRGSEPMTHVGLGEYLLNTLN